MKSISLPPSRLLQIAAWSILAVMLLAGVLYYALGIDAHDLLPGHHLCPVRAVTGVPCPGCGMTRAMLSMGQGHLGQAFRLNPFSFFVFLCIVVVALPKHLRKKMHALHHGRFIWVLLVCVLVFGSYRLYMAF